MLISRKSYFCLVIVRLDSNKNILLGSVLNRAAAMLHQPPTALYIFVDVNAFVPPELLTRLLSILQTSSVVTSKPVHWFIIHIVVNE